MVSIRGFLVLAGVVARVSGLVAELRLGTRLAMPVAPTCDSNHPADYLPSAKPPIGARAGRPFGAASASWERFAEPRGQERTLGGWQGIVCVG